MLIGVKKQIRISTVLTNLNGYNKVTSAQGTNVRKVISEVYAFFVLQCTVFGRKSKHKTDVIA